MSEQHVNKQLLQGLTPEQIAAIKNEIDSKPEWSALQMDTVNGGAILAIPEGLPDLPGVYKLIAAVMGGDQPTSDCVQDKGMDTRPLSMGEKEARQRVEAARAQLEEAFLPYRRAYPHGWDDWVYQNGLPKTR